MIGLMRTLRVILALVFVAFVLESVLLAIPSGGGGAGGIGGWPPGGRQPRTAPTPNSTSAPVLPPPSGG